MPLTEKDYKILNALDRNVVSSQRQLAKHLGISLGSLNYTLKSLLNKGLVKLGNFQSNPNKIVSYAYLLTPQGIEEEARLAVRFVSNRLKEYNQIREAIGDRVEIFSPNEPYRVAIVSPEIIREFLLSILEEKRPNVVVSGQYDSWEDIEESDLDSFDVILLFDREGKHPQDLGNAFGIPARRIIALSQSL